MLLQIVAIEDENGRCAALSNSPTILKGFDSGQAGLAVPAVKKAGLEGTTSLMMVNVNHQEELEMFHPNLYLSIK